MGSQLTYLEQDGVTPIPGNLLRIATAFTSTVPGRTGSVVAAVSNGVTLEAAASGRNGDYTGFRFITGGQEVVIGDYRGDLRLATPIPDFYPGPPNPGDPYVLTDARRLAVQNVGDESVTLDLDFLPAAQSPGGPFMRLMIDTAGKSCPYEMSAVLTNTADGGLFADAVPLYYVATAETADGQTVASIEVSVNLNDVTKRVRLRWTPPADVDFINLYRSEESGVYGPYSLVAQLPGDTAEYYDDGYGSLAAGAPPSVDESSGGPPLYGVPPSFSELSTQTGPTDLLTLHSGEIRYLWLGWNLTSAQAQTVTLGVALTPDPR